MNNNILVLLFISLFISCNQRTAEKIETENSTSNLVSFEQVDKLSITEINNNITNTTYNISIDKPKGWENIIGTAEHTIVKIIQKKFGAQISINYLKPNNQWFDDVNKLTEINLNELSLTDAQCRETTFQNKKALVLTGIQTVYVYSQFVYYDFTQIAICHNGGLLTINYSYPQQVRNKLKSTIENSIESISLNN